MDKKKMMVEWIKMSRKYEDAVRSGASDDELNCILNEYLNDAVGPAYIIKVIPNTRGVRIQGELSHEIVDLLSELLGVASDELERIIKAGVGAFSKVVNHEMREQIKKNGNRRLAQEGMKWAA